MKSKLFRWGLTALMVGTLAACGGGGGGDSTATTPPAATPPVVTPAAPTVPVPTGTAPVTLSATTPTATYAALAPTIPAVSVSIASPPKVTFSLTDAAGNAIIGFGSTSQSATATLKSYPNLAFSIAKLVPGANGAPSKWVSYIVTTVPTKTLAGAAVDPVPTRPTTDNTGTLVDNKDGTYTYTFYRDITKIKDQIAAMPAVTAPADKADLGDLTYDPNALHRLTIQVAGNVPGTGTNTADGTQTVAGVPLTNPINAIYDFIPATGKAVAPTDTVTQRLIVDKLSCNECHAKLGGVPGTDSAGFHGGSRYDPRYCVVCHTDQRKYGQARAVSTNYAFPVDSKGVPLSTYVADGVTTGDFPVLIHRVHKGEELIKQNYNYAGVLLNETKFPQDIRNCTKCHDNTAPKVAPQAGNYQSVPSRLACGACHDGINFATGAGKTNNGGAFGHIGGAQADDSKCALCHDAVSIKSVYHLPITPPNPNNALAVAGGSANTNAAWIASNTDNLPTGAIKVSYDISSVSRNATKNPVIVFKMLQNGVAVPFNTYSATGKTELWDGFFGGPSAYFVWAVPQDGIAAPADFNASASGWVRNIWNGSATGNSAGTMTGPDANGYYTVTLTGVQVPDSAVMLTGGLGYTYTLGSSPPLTQIGVKDPIASNTSFNTIRFGITQSALVKTAGLGNMGGLIVVTPDAQKAATGYTGRRAIVDDALCNKCHFELGMFTAEAFHAGQRNDGTTCAWCHNPNRTSSGWSAGSASFIHAIHGGAKRNVPFTWHASAVGKSFADIGYPGILNRCETCHLPGMYDFSAAASSAALPNRLYTTVGTGKYNGTVAGSLTTYSISPYVTADNVTNYGAGFAFNASAATASNITKADGTVFANPPQGIFDAEASTLVISPIATSCFSCHDSDVAKQHMESNGASIYRTRGAPDNALKKAEQCLFCHQSTSAFGLSIATVHK